MREIKFRAWHKANKCLPIETFGAGNFDNNLIDFGDFAESVGSNELVWMQYTGLKDKNNVEIYEGDIVSATYYGFSEGKSTKIKGQVIYDTEQFIGYMIDDTRMSACTNFKVIGNIYENPELLK